MITHWLIRGTGQKLHTRMKAPGDRREWPGEIRGHGIGYGVLNGALDAWRQTVEKGFHYLYADGPYWMRKKPTSIRLSWDRFWFDGYGPRRKGDLSKVGCVMKKQEKRGHQILLCTSAPPLHDAYNRVSIPGKSCTTANRDHWCEETVAEIKKHTDREIVIRDKPMPSKPIPVREKHMERAFKHAWCLVTAGSTIGVEAVCRGVPVISTQPCAVSPITSRSLSDIEDPRIPDDDERTEWAENLAARQFNVEQLSSGEAWRICEEDLQCVS